MKKGFTVVEVSILFVIFLIVAFLVAPLSLNDSISERNKSQWRRVQPEFANVFYTINTESDKTGFNLKQEFENIINNELKDKIDIYKIMFMNGTYPSKTYQFENFYSTIGGATLSYKYFDNPKDLIGIMMYDVNGSKGPNVWGKDVFGLNIYEDRFEPFCKSDSLNQLREDCSKHGTGLCCSSYYLNGGSIVRYGN